MSAVPPEIQVLIAKAYHHGLMQRNCPHYEFERMGGNIQTAKLFSLGEGNVPSHGIWRGAQIIEATNRDSLSSNGSKTFICTVSAPEIPKLKAWLETLLTDPTWQEMR